MDQVWVSDVWLIAKMYAKNLVEHHWVRRENPISSRWPKFHVSWSSHDCVVNVHCQSHCPFVMNFVVAVRPIRNRGPTQCLQPFIQKVIPDRTGTRQTIEWPEHSKDRIFHANARFSHCRCLQLEWNSRKVDFILWQQRLYVGLFGVRCRTPSSTDVTICPNAADGCH